MIKDERLFESQANVYFIFRKIGESVEIIQFSKSESVIYSEKSSLLARHNTLNICIGFQGLNVRTF